MLDTGGCGAMLRNRNYLRTCGHDRNNRTLAEVLLPDGTNVNHELVKDGWCWWYRKYAAGNAEREKVESEAREAQRGL